MIRRPPRSTPSDSSAASDVYKRQLLTSETQQRPRDALRREAGSHPARVSIWQQEGGSWLPRQPCAHSGPPPCSQCSPNTPHGHSRVTHSHSGLAGETRRVDRLPHCPVSGPCDLRGSTSFWGQTDHESEALALRSFPDKEAQSRWAQGLGGSFAEGDKP